MATKRALSRAEDHGSGRKAARSHVVSATAAAKTFGALVDRVRQTRAVYVVERGGIPVAEVSPVRTARCTLGDLAALLSSLPPAGEIFLTEVEAGIKRVNRPVVPDDRWER